MKTEVGNTIKVYKTTNYSLFKQLPGNRFVDEKHVNVLKRKIKLENLNPEYPIEVNSKMEVLDGQHRLEALKQLGLPIWYVVKENITINNVIDLNTGKKNWNWRDYAISFSERGNEEYTEFIEFIDTFRVQYTIALEYAAFNSNMNSKRRHEGGFYSGDFKMLDKKLSYKLTEQLIEICDTAHQPVVRNISRAALSFMRRPNYNHEEFIEKVRKYAPRLDSCYTVDDYIIAFDDIDSL